MPDKHDRNTGMGTLDLRERPPSITNRIEIGRVPPANPIPQHPHLKPVTSTSGMQGTPERHHPQDSELIAVHPTVTT